MRSNLYGWPHELTQLCCGDRQCLRSHALAGLCHEAVAALVRRQVRGMFHYVQYYYFKIVFALARRPSLRLRPGCEGALQVPCFPRGGRAERERRLAVDLRRLRVELGDRLVQQRVQQPVHRRVGSGRVAAAE